MGAFFFVLCAVAVAAYALTGLYLYHRQRGLQYAPTHKDIEGKGNPLFKPWRSAKGEFLGYIRTVLEPRRVVLFFHGGSGEAIDRAWADELVPRKDLLILVEYPGYGARKGKTGEAEILADTQKVIEEARRLWGDLPLLALGEGLGATAASYVASLQKVERLALISPFASGQSVAAHRYRFFPVQWLVKEKYPTVDYLTKAKAPLHVVHGTLDDFVPLEQGRTVFQSYSGGKKELDEVPGFGHSNLVDAILHSPFTARFRAFIAD